MKKRKIFTVVLIFSILMATLAGCDKADKVSDTTKKPVIKIGSDNYPPYNFLNEDGIPTGIDVELATEAFRRMGYKTEIVQINWEKKKELVESGKIDCIMGCFSMEGRLNDYRWAGPYIASRQVVAVNENSDIHKLSDLKGKNLAVQSTTKPEGIFLKRTDKRIPKLGNLISLGHRELIYTFLAKGYVDAVAVHEESIIQYMKDYDTSFRILKEPLMVVGIGAAFAKNDDRGICEQMNQKLEESGCEKLYARSFYEACLIYAFERQMGYEEWKELFSEGRKIFEESDGAQKRFFRGGKITLKELEEYMEAESVSEELETMLLTRSLEEKIIQSDSAEEFWSFVQENIEKFSSVRERARYYFCKYLYFYIQDRCDRYYESCIREEKLRNQYGNMLEKGERGREEKFALEELAFLKPLTKLKKDADKQKNNMSLEEKKEYLRIIESSNEFLLQLIGDILDISKIESGKMEFIYTTLRLSEIFAPQQQAFALRVAPGVKVIFESDGNDYCIVSEKTRLTQVLTNFLSNAVKFTSSGSIRFGYRLTDDGIYVYVTDTGMGISKESQASIFNRFVKLNSFKQGTGLGLSICKTIIEKLKGKIGVESEEGKGSTFWFTIPCQPMKVK